MSMDESWRWVWKNIEGENNDVDKVGERMGVEIIRDL